MVTKGAVKGKGGYGAVRGGNQFQRPTPYEAPAERESAICSVHNKKRSMECLQHDPATDTYMCAGRNQCKESISNAGEQGGGGDTAMCAFHQKNRLLSSLEMDQWGGYSCIPSAQCKVSAAQGGQPYQMPAHRPQHRQSPAQQDGQGLCILHNKARSWTCLQEDGFGTFRCIPPHTCKVKEGEPIAAPPVFGGKGLFGGKGQGYGADRRRPIAAPQVFPIGQDSVLCGVHNKKRSMANLQRGPSGLMECIPGQECKVQGMGDAPYMQAFDNAGDSGSYVCSMHGKTRSASVMVDDGAGGYQCSPTAQCKVKMGGDIPGAQGGSGTAPCSTHGKTRTMTCLMDDGQGGMMCTPEHECK
eukprot:GEMP01028963.1.p1 GENE.GEMP01028963.1~~GEMP01028963.1.p1  ORF type:complete len:377 (+),score=78.63 GEMP01028963.1:63-1133(+)